MKLFELFYLFENRLDFLKRSLLPKLSPVVIEDPHAPNDPIKAIEHFADIDPSPNNRYTQWIANQYIKRMIKWEDLYKVTNILSDFDRVKKHLDKKDINQYKSYRDLGKAVTDVQPEKSKKQQRQEIKTEGAEKVADGPKSTIIRLKTEEAACYYGKGTKWCTAADEADNMFDAYNKDGPLYVVLGKDGRKFQYHPASGQFMDEQDDPVDPYHIYNKYPEMKQLWTEEEIDESSFIGILNQTVDYMKELDEDEKYDLEEWLLNVPDDTIKRSQIQYDLIQYIRSHDPINPIPLLDRLIENNHGRTNLYQLLRVMNMYSHTHPIVDKELEKQKMSGMGKIRSLSKHMPIDMIIQQYERNRKH